MIADFIDISSNNQEYAITIFICFLAHGCYISSIRWQQKEFILQSFGLSIIELLQA
jgi:hypothetical protein